MDFDNSGKTLKWQTTEVVAKTKTTPQTTVQVILIGDVVYARKVPGKTDGKWLQVTATQAGLSSALSSGEVDPSTMLAKFSKGIQTFKYVGPTTINGAPVEEYYITFEQR